MTFNVQHFFAPIKKKGKVREDSEVNEKSCKGRQLYCLENGKLARY